MSVIGRLDKQVEDVLITPLEKKEPKVNHEQVENSGSDESVENARRKVKHIDERDALPVWLL
jgi:hypothetical protein